MKRRIIDADELMKRLRINSIIVTYDGNNATYGLTLSGIRKVIDELEVHEAEQNEYTQIDCPMNQTECGENCVYYNKFLLKCPMKVKGNGGEQEWQRF